MKKIFVALIPIFAIFIVATAFAAPPDVGKQKNDQVTLATQPQEDMCIATTDATLLPGFTEAVSGINDVKKAAYPNLPGGAVFTDNIELASNAINNTTAVKKEAKKYDASLCQDSGVYIGNQQNSSDNNLINRNNDVAAPKDTEPVQTE
jgi:hypothetical protein